MSPRTTLLAAALLALAIFPATRCAADASDTAVDQVFSAIRDGNFSKATAHFNHGMSATLTPAVLEDAWKKTYGNEGPLLSWKKDGLKGVARVKVETFPALNHLFIAGEGKPNPAEYNTPGHVDQAVVAAIADFVASSGGKK